MLPEQMPVPPAGMVMPASYEPIFIANVVLLAFVAAWVLRMAMRMKSPVPVIIMLGATLATGTESMWDNLDAVWYAAIGQTPLYRGFDVSVPGWVLLAYAWYMGGISCWVYQRLHHGMSRRMFWTVYFFGWLANCVLEMPALHMGIYAYYGAQPFVLFGFPFWQAMGNALTPLLTAALIYACRSEFSGLGSLLIIPTYPAGLIFALGGIGWPTMLALHSGLGYRATYPAATASFLIALMLGHVVSRKVCRPNAARAGSYQTDGIRRWAFLRRACSSPCTASKKGLSV